jgi:hypothetical protein
MCPPAGLLKILPVTNLLFDEQAKDHIGGDDGRDVR